MNIGSHHSEETKQQMKLSHIGLKHTEAAKLKIKLANMGRKHTEETKIKLSNLKYKGNNAKPATGRYRAEKLFVCPKGYQRHHIDGNPLNNNPDNIEILTPKEHMVKDGRLEKFIHSTRSKGVTFSAESRQKMSAYAKTRKRNNKGVFC